MKVFVPVGTPNDQPYLDALWGLSVACHDKQMPLMAEMFPLTSKDKEAPDKDLVAKYSRIAAELGADMVKTSYTGSPDSFRYITSTTFVPVVILGGPNC